MVGGATVAIIDPVELGRWERGLTERTRFGRALRGSCYNAVPKLVGWTLTVPRLIFGSIRGLLLLALSLWPIWLKFYDETTTLSWGEAVGLSALISAALIYSHWYDKIVREYKPRTVRGRLYQKLALELCGTIAGFTKSVKVRRKEEQPNIDVARKKVLECIRTITQLHLRDYEGVYLEATLWLFDDADCRHMRIAERTTTARPVGKVVNSEDVMAFYVAKSRKHRVVNDFLRDNHPFPKSGLSADKPPYRSILLIPLLDTSSGSPDTCIGVVSIDSSRPYHFWPGSGDELVVKLSPYTTWLMLLLSVSDVHHLRCAA